MSQIFHRSVSLAALMAALIPVALPQGAGAQTIDYGSLEQLFGEPVTTSATGKPQRATEAPVSMEIITADDIRRAAAVDIPGILREYTTLDVLSWAPGVSDVSVRGYNQPLSPRLLVLVNGRQVYLDDYGRTAWSTIPVQLPEIRQIEVVKGPNTALFGFNAVSGVVNIITYSPLYDDVSNVRATVGTNGYREGSVVHTMKFSEKAGVRVSAGGSISDGFGSESWPAASRANYQDKPSRRSLNVDSLFQVADRAQLGAELTFSAAHQNDVLPYYAVTRGEYRTMSGKLQYTQETENLGLIEASIYRNSLSYDVSPTLEPFRNDVTVVKLQDLFKVGTNHSFRVAGEYRHNSIDNILAGNSETSYDNWSLSGMWDWAVNDRLSLTNAVRVDHLILNRDNLPATVVASYGPYWSLSDYDRSMTEFSFNSGLVYKATQNDTFRLSVARGLQVPSLLEFGIMYGGVTNRGLGVFTGNPTLDPTVVMNYEVAYDRNIAPIDAVGRVSLFYQTSDGIKLAASTTANASRNGVPYAVIVNGGESSAYGVEASLKGKVGSHWRWGLGYRFEKLDDDIDGYPSGAVGPTRYENSTPRHRANANVGFTYGKFEGDLFAQAVSSFDMLRVSGSTLVETEIPAALMLDARLAYNVMDNVTVALHGTSINQAEYRPTSLGTVERQVFVTVNAKF